MPYSLFKLRFAWLLSYTFTGHPHIDVSNFFLLIFSVLIYDFKFIKIFHQTFLIAISMKTIVIAIMHSVNQLFLFV